MASADGYFYVYNIPGNLNSYSIYLSVHLSKLVPIYLSTCRSILKSIYPSICLLSNHQSLHFLSIYLNTNLIYLSINQSMYQSITLSINQSIHLSVYLFTYLSIYLSNYLFYIYLSIHLYISLYQGKEVSVHCTMLKQHQLDTVSLSIYLFYIYLFIYLFIYLSIYLSHNHIAVRGA